MPKIGQMPNNETLCSDHMLRRWRTPTHKFSYEFDIDLARFLLRVVRENRPDQAMQRRLDFELLRAELHDVYIRTNLTTERLRELAARDADGCIAETLEELPDGVPLDVSGGDCLPSASSAATPGRYPKPSQPKRLPGGVSVSRTDALPLETPRNKRRTRD